jgi:hypothetical protein
LSFGSGGSGSTSSQLTASNTSAINDQGLLTQPWYFDNTTPGRNAYYKLTYSNNPLSLEVGAGTGGTRWNGNSTFATASADAGASAYGVRPDGYLEIGGYKPGTGTGPGGGPKGSGVIESVVPITFGGSGGASTARVSNRYELAEGNQFVTVTTTVNATGGHSPTWGFGSARTTTGLA